ncbi:lipoyl synthase [candidate division WOR-1 bacterium DG_54_3]|uniref:Lipoyl synthase n=1 Tax=candidate division WOR-1 bacterium DG_54_3 TaxID=1703775 RepID=A0A0S7Y454_UNCSA|nr:MAG: lipoyl synthase [candidate division WOR-1 bacterium DG_54_3]
MALPQFLIKRIPKQENIRKIRNLIDDCRIHTVCESAKCPNIGECFSKNTLTFMILGDVCTRNCRFCGISKGKPSPPDPEEPERITLAVKKLGLKYVVITSVSRDDLPDGGASQFAAVIKCLRPLKVEALIPDFQGSEPALKTVLDAEPYVLNHNLETIPRLYSKIRSQADYQRSLWVLKMAKNRGLYTKSGLMVGLGENKEDVFSALQDLRRVECNIVTIGQYLPPTNVHPKAERYVRPEEFEEYRAFGKALGFLEVFSGSFVRSSYRAGEIMEWKKPSVS